MKLNSPTHVRFSAMVLQRNIDVVLQWRVQNIIKEMSSSSQTERRQASGGFIEHLLILFYFARSDTNCWNRERESSLIYLSVLKQVIQFLCHW